MPRGKANAYDFIKVGQTYDQWIVLGAAPKGFGGKKRFECQCACGIIKSLFAARLINGKASKCSQCSNSSRRNTIEKLLLRLILCSPTTLKTGCWEYSKTKSEQGYGKATMCSKTRLVHRMVYEHFKGPIPDDMMLHHKCHNPPCCNFEHLVPVTAAEHLMLGDTLQRRNKLKTHCVHGHEYNAENTGLAKTGRYCKTCKTEQRNKRYWDNKEQILKEEQVRYRANKDVINARQREQYRRKKNGQNMGPNPFTVSG